MISSLVDTRHLDAFLAVCREGTLQRAAVHIHKTQPAISYDIKRLEEAIGAALFERSGRRLLLTETGRRLRDLGERYAAAFRELRHEVRGGSVSPTGLRIATVSGFGRYVLYPRLRDVVHTSTGAVVMLFRTASEVFQMVEDAEVDCGAVYHTKISNRLQFTPVYQEELVLITPKRMRMAAGKWRQLGTYAKLSFVTYEEGDYVFGRWFDVQFGRQPASGLARWHVSELEEVIDAVAHDAGVSIVPLDAVQKSRAAVSIIRPAHRRCINQVFGVTRVSAPRHASIDRLFDGLMCR